MTRLTLIATLSINACLLMLLFKECAYLAPLRWEIWNEYGDWILGFSGALFANLFAVTHTVIRRLTLAHTGQKLTHVEKQLRDRATLVRELTDRILERR